MLIYLKRLRLISLAIHLFAKTFTVSFQLKETETKAIVRVFNEPLTTIYLETSLPTPYTKQMLLFVSSFT